MNVERGERRERKAIRKGKKKDRMDFKKTKRLEGKRREKGGKEGQVRERRELMQREEKVRQ